jgi:hypothetical protein
MAVTRGDWSKWLAPGAKKAFVKHYPTLPAQYTQFFQIETSQRAYEDYLFSSGLGTVPEKPEGQDIAFDRPYPLGSARVSHRGYGLGYEITEEMVDDDLYKVIVPKSSRFLADAHRDAEERKAASVFNLAFTTQLSYDGISLIDTAHPSVDAGDLSNQHASNVDISLTALQTAVEHFMLLKDDRGLFLSVDSGQFQVITHPTQFWIVREILSAEFKPFTANNERNILRDEFNMVPKSYKYLTDLDAWYAFKPGQPAGPMFFWRKRPTTGKLMDERAGVMGFFVKSRFSVLAPDWRPFYGSTGT